MSTRTIVLTGEVDAELAGDFLRTFAEVDALGEDIIIKILSTGGELPAAMAIYDTVVAASSKVTTLALGEVSSAAVLIFQAGDYRIVGPNCSMLLHESYATGVEGPSNYVRKQAEETARLHNRYCTLLAKRAERDFNDIWAVCAGETFLDAKGILDLGLADEALYEVD